MPDTIEAILSVASQEIERIVWTSHDRDEALQTICQLLHDKVNHYDWVGVYLVHPRADRELLLGPYVGADTDHTRIKFGQGICGQAADAEKTFVVQDVSQEVNYLSCSVTVKSEIVVPIFKDGLCVAELDIDSHQLAPFRDADQIGLEKIAEQLARLF